MCKGGSCPLKETCYRFKAKPSTFQSFFLKIPYMDGCKYYSKYEVSEGDWKTGEINESK
jgi:hypothetical protein